MRLYFEDFTVGDVRWSEPLAVDRDEMLEYARRNDREPFHVDEEAARRSPFGGLIASGGFTISLMYRLLHARRRAAGEESAFLGGFDWHVKFLTPVRADEVLRLRSTTLRKRLSSKAGRGVVQTLAELVNQDEQVVLSVEAAVLVATRSDEETGHRSVDEADHA